jgi:hypothetical protein
MGLKGIKNPQKIVEDFITNGTLELDDDWQRYRKRI